MKVIIDPRNPLEVYDTDGNLLFHYKGISLTLKLEDLEIAELDTLGLSEGEIEQIKQLLEQKKRTFY